MEKQWLAVDYQRAIVFDRCHLALRVHFFDLFEFPFDKQSAGFCLCSSLYGAVRQKENHSLRISNPI
jgi:hypothetical protein